MRLSARCRDLSIQSLNPAVLRAEYAVSLICRAAGGEESTRADISGSKGESF